MWPWFLGFLRNGLVQSRVQVTSMPWGGWNGEGFVGGFHTYSGSLGAMGLDLQLVEKQTVSRSFFRLDGKSTSSNHNVCLCFVP